MGETGGGRPRGEPSSRRPAATPGRSTGLGSRTSSFSAPLLRQQSTEPPKTVAPSPGEPPGPPGARARPLPHRLRDADQVRARKLGSWGSSGDKVADVAASFLRAGLPCGNTRSVGRDQGKTVARASRTPMGRVRFPACVVRGPFAPTGPSWSAHAVGVSVGPPGPACTSTPRPCCR
jgi:hypothetical protein